MSAFCDPMDCSTQASLSTISQTLLKFMSIELVMLSNCLFLDCLYLLLPLIFLSIRIISNEMALCITWPIKVHIVKAMVFSVVIVSIGQLRRLSTKELMLLNFGAGGDS